ncbi:MAG: LPS export ABC transporter periplasmic protein LptC [Spirochaetota bacterium]
MKHSRLRALLRKIYLFTAVALTSGGVFLATVLLNTGCSFNYSEAEMAEGLADEVPNSIIRSYRFVDVRSGRSSFEVYAAEARMFHKIHQTRLTTLFFREISPEGEVVTEGEAEQATIFTQTDNVEMRGKIRFSGSAQQSTIITDYLFWNNEERLLKGKPDHQVTILKSDGTRIEGKGFIADAARQEIEFSQEVDGLYVQEAEEND